MMGSNFNDETECGSFFDNIDDLIECPSDNDIDFISGNSNDFQSILTSNVEELPVNDISYNSGNCNDFQSILTNNVEELPHNDMSYNSGDGNDFQSIWANNDDMLPAPEPMFPETKKDNCSDLSAELAVPYEEIKHLEWLSNFMEESFTGGGMTVNIENVPVDNKPSQNQFRTSSPISVLDSSSSSSCSEGKTSPPSPSHLGRQRGTRSKRPRPANFNPRTAMQFMTPSPCVTDNRQQVDVPVISAESMNFADSHQIKIPKPVSEKKKQKLKQSSPTGSAESNCSPLGQQASVRKCLHCEITKTPQWRAGPLGPKTLCNACGVRYKSGRLFPEYRPAASPTFIPSVHSNSHKKVVEMRIKGGDRKFMNAAVPPISCEPDMIPNPSLKYM